jgi:hypothetical protein
VNIYSGLLVFLILLVLAASPLTLNQVSQAEANETPISPSMLHGVNLPDLVLLQTDLGYPSNIGSPPPVNTSLLLIKSYGFNFVRIPYYWEAYDANPNEFLDEVELIASTADELGLYVDWDFHQLRTSSFLFNENYYGGFPHFLLRNYEFNGGSYAEEKFWTDFYNNTIIINGKSAWDLQAEFMHMMIDKLERHSSTVGYEILNAPPVYDTSQYAKIGKYHTFMAEYIRSKTSKYILFDYACPVPSCKSVSISDQSLIAPLGVNNTIFAPHRYGSPFPNMLSTLEALSAKWGHVPIIMGEWARRDPMEMAYYILQMRNANIGWAFWSWGYQATGEDGVSLNDKNYIPTLYLRLLLKAISNIPENYDSSLAIVTNKNSYGLADNLLIYGNLNVDKPINATSSVLIQIIDPKGKTSRISSVDMSPILRSFVSKFKIDSSLGPSGEYRVIAVYPGYMGETKFNFTAQNVQGYGCAIHLCVYALRVDDPGANRTTYDIHYRFAGGINDVRVNSEYKSLRVNITSGQSGIILLSLPRHLIESKMIDGNNTRFVTLVDGEIVDYSEITDASVALGELDVKLDNFRVISVNSTAGTHLIELRGTSVIPEFCEQNIVVYFVAMVTSVYLGKRKFCHHYLKDQ